MKAEVSGGIHPHGDCKACRQIEAERDELRCLLIYDRNTLSIVRQQFAASEHEIAELRRRLDAVIEYVRNGPPIGANVVLRLARGNTDEAEVSDEDEDIVAWLRNAAGDYADADRVHEAADEIEKLRTALAEARRKAFEEAARIWPMASSPRSGRGRSRSDG